jgi:hypothetical protein
MIDTALGNFDMTVVDDDEYVHVSEGLNNIGDSPILYTFSQNQPETQQINQDMSATCFNMNDPSTEEMLNYIDHLLLNYDSQYCSANQSNSLIETVEPYLDKNSQSLLPMISVSACIDKNVKMLPKAVFKTHCDEMLIYEVLDKEKRKWRAKFIGQEIHEHEYDLVSERQNEITLFDLKKKIFIRISPTGWLFFGPTPLHVDRLFNTGEWIEFRVWKDYAKQICYKCVLNENNEMTADWEEYKDGKMTTCSFLFVHAECDELILQRKMNSTLIKLNSKELCQRSITESEYEHVYYGTWEFSVKGADQAQQKHGIERPVWMTPFTKLRFFKTRDNQWFEKFQDKEKPENVYKEWSMSETNKEVVLFDINRKLFVKLSDQGGLFGYSLNQMYSVFGQTNTWCTYSEWKMCDKENYFVKTDVKNWTGVIDGEPLSVEFEFIDNEEDEVVLQNKSDFSYVKLNSKGMFLKESTSNSYVEQGKGTWTEMLDSRYEIHSIQKLVVKALFMTSYLNNSNTK